MKRDYSVDIIKIIACLCVIILHIFSPSESLSVVNVIYLLGTFGIPLFFAANGYLLYGKELSFHYCGRKCLKIVKFMLPWILMIGAVACLKEKSLWGGYYKTILGVCNCSGYLFHFWFLLALIIIYIIIAILNTLCQRCMHKSLQDIISLWTLAPIIILMEGVQIANILLVHNGLPAIRQLIWPEFRLITNLGYFFIGMIISKERNIFVNRIGSKGLTICICSYIYVEIMEQVTFHFTWASSYYDSIFIVLGVMGLFVFLLRHDFAAHADKISFISQCTMPAYILHPLMKIVMVRVGNIIGLEGVMLSSIEYVIIIFTIPVFTYIISKTRLKFLIKL